MFSTPPAMNASPSPALIAWLHWRRLRPSRTTGHRLAGTSTGRPARSSAMRATCVVLSCLIGAAKITSSMTGVDTGALDDRFDRNGREIIRPHTRQRSPVLPHGRSQAAQM